MQIIHSNSFSLFFVLQNVVAIVSLRLRCETFEIASYYFTWRNLSVVLN